MIRLTKESDFDALLDIATTPGLFEPNQTELLAKMLRLPGEHDLWFTNDTDNGPVGVAYLVSERMKNRTWNLALIAVHLSHQRQGLGKTFPKHVQDWLRLNV